MRFRIIGLSRQRLCFVLSWGGEGAGCGAEVAENATVDASLDAWRADDRNGAEGNKKARSELEVQLTMEHRSRPNYQQSSATIWRRPVAPAAH